MMMMMMMMMNKINVEQTATAGREFPAAGPKLRDPMYFVVRLVKFNDEWLTLEKFFDEFSLLKLVDASAAIDDVTDVVDDVIQQILLDKEPPEVQTDRQTDGQTDINTLKHNTHTHTHTHTGWPRK